MSVQYLARSDRAHAWQVDNSSLGIADGLERDVRVHAGTTIPPVRFLNSGLREEEADGIVEVLMSRWPSMNGEEGPGPSISPGGQS